MLCTGALVMATETPMTVGRTQSQNHTKIGDQTHGNSLSGTVFGMLSSEDGERTSERVEEGRKNRDEGLAFTRPHLSHRALVKHNAAHELNIEGPQAQGAV